MAEYPVVRIKHSEEFDIILSGEDLDMAAHNWTITSSGYAQRYIKGCGIRGHYEAMHRAIAQRILDEQSRGTIPERMEIDHINGDRLDNRRVNLRIVTRQQNAQNSRRLRTRKVYKYKGVTRHWLTHRYRASIYHSGRRIELGVFADEVSAALAYDAYAKVLFGDHARLNFPQ